MEYISPIILLLLSAALAIFRNRDKVAFVKMDYKVTETVNSVKNIDEKVDILQGQVELISHKDDFRDRLYALSLDAQNMINSDDRASLKFIDTCVDISLGFYDMLLTKPLSHITEEDIEKCSELAIGRASSGVIGLEEDFVDMFWVSFKNKAEEVRPLFYEIFQGVLNDKKKAFEDAISNYLRWQFNTFIRYRIEFNIKK